MLVTVLGARASQLVMRLVTPRLSPLITSGFVPVRA